MVKIDEDKLLKNIKDTTQKGIDELNEVKKDEEFLDKIKAELIGVDEELTKLMAKQNLKEWQEHVKQYVEKYEKNDWKKDEIYYYKKGQLDILNLIINEE